MLEQQPRELQECREAKGSPGCHNRDNKGAGRCVSPRSDKDLGLAQILTAVAQTLARRLRS